MGIHYSAYNHDGSGEMRTGMTTVLGLPDQRDTLKMLRETLCSAQSAITYLKEQVSAAPDDDLDIERLERLIAEIDRQRPLGVDGKHGDLHTSFCQCDRFGTEG